MLLLQRPSHWQTSVLPTYPPTDIPTYLNTYPQSTGDPDDLCYFPEDSPNGKPPSYLCNVTFFDRPVTKRFPQLQTPPYPPDTALGKYVEGSYLPIYLPIS